MNIALVEPSRAVRDVMAKLLDERGHSVLGFADSCDVLEHVASDETLDALITSVELTPLSGPELCWEARLLAKRRRPIYIMLMSSNIDERMMIECLDMGADDVIPSRPASNSYLLGCGSVSETYAYSANSFGWPRPIR